MDTLRYGLAHVLDRRPRASLAIIMSAVVSVGCSDRTGDPLEPDAPQLERSARSTRAGFSDEFSTFDLSRWSKEEHPLGFGFFRVANVRQGDGTVDLVLPAGTYDGGEIRSVDLFGYGTYVIRMRTPSAPGSITAFFLYEGRYRSDEIDIELYNDGTQRVLLTTWVRGRRTNYAMTTLPSDPREYHRYVIDWTSSHVRFYQDGVMLQDFTSDLPRRAMHVMANAWWPTWLSGSEPKADAKVEIDRIDATPN